MKVNFKYGIRTISGKLDDLVHMAWNKGRVAVARVFIYPTLVAQHLLFGDIKTNIADIWADCSEEFKNDFKEYTLQRVPYYTAFPPHCNEAGGFTSKALYISLCFLVISPTRSLRPFCSKHSMTSSSSRS